jgi:hypothetical protein
LEIAPAYGRSYSNGDFPKQPRHSAEIREAAQVRRAALATMILAAALTASAEQPTAGPVIALADRHAQAIPIRSGCTYAGGGTFDVRQPTPDAIVVTMVGAVVATSHPAGSSAVMDFDFDEVFEIVGAHPDARPKLSLEAELIGLLRGGRIAAALTSSSVMVSAGENVVVTANFPDRAVACGDNLAVNDRIAPDDVTVAPGVFTLHAHWTLSATHPKGLRGKAASAEFAPEPALDPIWVGGPRDPFHGIVKKDFGLRVTLKVVSQSIPAAPRP